MSDEQKPDGGPAFPQISIEEGKHDGHGDLIEPITSSAGGMTLRDYFAAAAMQGWLATHTDCEHPCASGNENFVAVNSYKLADAMLKARAA